MISTEMKVGDIFSDGDCYYMVDKIVPEGYQSHIITKEEAEAEFPMNPPEIEKPKRTRKKA